MINMRMVSIHTGYVGFFQFMLDHRDLCSFGGSEIVSNNGA